MITPRPASALAATLFLVALAGASCRGTDFVRAEYEANPLDHSQDWIDAPPRTAATTTATTGRRSAQSFRNTYYDFPSEGAGKKDAKVFDAACAPIADVTKDFHDKVCLQGSGRLANGQTISFAKRDCPCAAECPKSAQKICFEALDPKAFPSGRGALGQPVTPLRTIAVDDAVIALGSVVYIPEFDGLAKPDGTSHDGCFVAEDRGSKVVGYHVDIFTGDPATTKTWNQAVPSNDGVRVEVDAPRCAYLKKLLSQAPK